MVAIRMPYEIKKVPGGFKVCKAAVEPEKCFSKKPLTKATAQKQRIAILISEHAKKPKAKAPAAPAPRAKSPPRARA